MHFSLILNCSQRQLYRVTIVAVDRKIILYELEYRKHLRHDSLEDSINGYDCYPNSDCNQFRRQLCPLKWLQFVQTFLIQCCVCGRSTVRWEWVNSNHRFDCETSVDCMIRRKRKHLTHHGSLAPYDVASSSSRKCSYLLQGKHNAHVNGNNYSYVPIKTFLSSPLLPRMWASNEGGGNFIIHTKRQIWKALNETRSPTQKRTSENSFQLHKILRVSGEFCWQWTWNVISIAWVFFEEWRKRRWMKKRRIKWFILRHEIPIFKEIVMLLLRAPFRVYYLKWLNHKPWIFIAPFLRFRVCSHGSLWWPLVGIVCQLRLLMRLR